MVREQRWEFRWAYRDNDGEWVEKVCYPRSEEKKDANVAKCREAGYKVISIKKLYPFSTERNQHNFMLISNICSNRMHDMLHGEAEYDEAEYERLWELKEKADRFYGLPLPVAWLPWEDLKEARGLAMEAVEHRANACVEAGRPDLVQYC